MFGPGAIYYFKYQKLYNEVYTVLHIDDLSHLLLTNYCGDVINKFTCPSKIRKCIEEKTKRFPVKCINCKKFNYKDSEFCIHFPWKCEYCSHNVKDENGIKWYYDGTCCKCALFNKNPMNFDLDDVRDGHKITIKFIELGFQYEMTRNNEPIPPYSHYKNYRKYYDFLFDSFEIGRQYALKAKQH